MPEHRVAQKIQETKALASDRGVDPRAGPLLATFEMPIWGAAVMTHEVAELARIPGTAVAVVTVDPLPEARRALETAPHLHAVAERGLVCGLSGGAVLHVYPPSPREMESFAVALFAGAAPDGLSLALSGFVSSGRQEVSFESTEPPPSPRELLHAIRNRGGTAAFASDDEEAIVVDDLPPELEAARAALAGDLPGRPVRVTRLPSGRFRFVPARPGRVARDELHATAQGIAMSCDRFLEVRGTATFGFVTEPVARWRYGPEDGARRLASELFSGAPDTVISHLGLHPFRSEGTIFFAYEGSETVWEAANKGVACVTVRDIHEYGLILHAIREGEE